MALLPLRRKKTTSSTPQVPEEVEQYYESTRKERVGIAWLLALATLLLTLLLAFGIFFAGRWAYRKITHEDTDVQTTTQQEGSQGEQSPDTAAGTDDADTSNDADETPTAPVPAPVATPTPTQTPTTGPSGSELPHTGPDVSD